MKTILLVDDDASYIRALARALRMEGYLVLQANSVAGAKRELLMSSVDIVVTDNDLGVDNEGVRLINEIRQRLHSKIPIILCSGRPFQDILDDCLCDGRPTEHLTDFFQKPVPVLKLVERVTELFSRRPELSSVRSTIVPASSSPPPPTD